MTKTEDAAKRYLLEFGYSKVLKIHGHNKPDFLCDDKDRYEVKKGKFYVIFQLDQLLEYKTGDTLMIFDNKENLVKMLKLKEIDIKIKKTGERIEK